MINRFLILFSVALLTLGAGSIAFAHELTRPLPASVVYVHPIEPPDAQSGGPR